MTSDHLGHLAVEIYKVLENSVVDLSNRYRDMGLTHKRFRWDLLYMAVGSEWVCENLYPYLNDDHIDTALRNIVIPYSNPSKFDKN